MYASPLFYTKGSDILLQYPINVRPENISIPSTGGLPFASHASFTFQGDYLSYVLYRCIDCATNEIVYDSVGVGRMSRTPIAYNGDEVSVGSLASHITSGHNYVIQFLLAQRTQDGEDNLYDMPCVSGTITANTGTLNSFVLENNLPIYEWSSTHQPTRDIENVVVVGMVMKIGDETRFITDYNPDDGVVTVYSPFTSEVKAGTRYKIYSNYLITPQYYFKCRDLPTISASIYYGDYSEEGTLKGRGIVCSANYSQQDNVMIKYYTATLYASYHDTQKEYKLSQTGKIYSQRTVQIFDYCILGLSPWNGELPIDVDYRVEFEIVTQDNAVYEAEATMRKQAVSEEYVPWDTINIKVDKRLGCVQIIPRKFSTSDPMAHEVVTRTDLITGEQQILRADLRNNYPFQDFEVRANGSYEYAITYYNYETGQVYNQTIERYRVTTDSLDGYTITSLTANIWDTVNDDTFYIVRGNGYTVEETWHFICDIEDTTMTHNYDKHLQVGYGRYPAVTSTETNYLTGTLTAMLGYINCATKEYVDDIALVNAWRKFISQPRPFLLKSPKGDVWIVNITDASTSYDEKTPKHPTTFSFSWAECDDIERSRVGTGGHVIS